MKRPEDVLKQYWGFDSFRPLQDDIIESVLDGKDTLAILPTGGGKSLCFQVPGMCLEGLTLVVSPLISLMNDQVHNLKLKGVTALALHSGLTAREAEIEYTNLRNGKYKFVYASPEKVKSERFLWSVSELNIDLLAIDEAHCISQWGHDFRPEYLELEGLRKELNCPCIALTASATPKVVQDIIKYLKFKDGNKIFKQSVKRTNLNYVVLKEEHKSERLLRILQKIKGTGIVYARNRKQTAAISDFLHKNNIASDFYHAGLDSEEREKKQTLWKAGKIRVIVCTNAFGMGIDKPDVRLVIHYEIPDTPEAYYQESGRAGRDGLESWCVLLIGPSDLEKNEKWVIERFLDKNQVKNVFNAFCNHHHIPYGGGFEQLYDLDANELNKKYKLKVQDLYRAFEMLSREGLVSLSESYAMSSRIKILMDQEELYWFYVKKTEYEFFLKTLLRMYGGLFDHYTPVSEYEISNKLHHSVNEVRQKLTRLNSLKVLEYLPRNEQPQICFLEERPRNLPYNTKRWNHLKLAALQRWNAMKNYVDTINCRQIALGEYFGEKKIEDCGKCDNCRNRKRDRSSEIKVFREILIQRSIQNKIGQKEMKDLIEADELKINVLRDLMDKGIIVRDKNGNYQHK
ncbi:MAG: RecQ family ATP-dependent DNA helicase [Flavobacteriales bacterium]|nr:RecQ family ATP-dependent DNA helicase [Flavobacteriales bacterium]